MYSGRPRRKITVNTNIRTGPVTQFWTGDSISSRRSEQ